MQQGKQPLLRSKKPELVQQRAVRAAEAHYLTRKVNGASGDWPGKSRPAAFKSA